MSVVHLHIGLEKTGTTALQNLLSENSKMLTEQRFLYYRSPHANGRGLFPNAAELLPYALDDHRGSSLKKLYRLESQDRLDIFRRDLKGSISAFLGKKPDAEGIFSLEHLSRFIRSEREWLRIKELFNAANRTVKVHIYLRRQDDFCVSFYPTDLIKGRRKPFEFPSLRGVYGFLLFDKFLRVLGDIFGIHNLSVYSYEVDSLGGGGTARHFCSRIGLNIDGFKVPSDGNPRLGAKEAEFLRLFNENAEESSLNLPPSLRTTLRLSLQRESMAEGGFEPGEALRSQFLEKFLSSNASVNKKWFSGEEVLPCKLDNLSRYKRYAPSLTVSDVVRISSRLIIKP